MPGVMCVQKAPLPQAIVTAQRVCGVAVALLFVCFLLSGSRGGVSNRDDAIFGTKRQKSAGSQPDSSWQFFTAQQQRPVEPAPAKTLSWEEARAWVRQGLEALAAADGEQGWRAVADPLAALRDDASTDRTASSRRERLLLGSYRASEHGWPFQWGGGGRAVRRRQLGEGTKRAAEAAAQGMDPDSLDVPADSVDEDGEDSAADARAPTALVVVPTANVWNRTAAMIGTLEMCRDRFELLVRARVAKYRARKCSRLGLGDTRL